MNTITQNQQQFIDATVARIKAEVAEDIRNGTVDADEVETFGDLHDFVDANAYGGMCGDEWVDRGNQLFPRGPGEDGDTIYSQALMAVADSIQEAVDEWIRTDEFAALKTTGSEQ